MKEIVFLLIVVKCAQAQVNGEFWWLNDKVKSINNFNENPKFEDDDLQIDTGFIEKIVFKDSVTSYTVPDRNVYKRPKQKIVHKNKLNDKLTLPDNNRINVNTSGIKSNDTKDNNSDEFVFKYSDESPEFNINLNKTHEKYIEFTKNSSNNQIRPDVFDRITFTYNKKDESVLTENICTYILKEECLKKYGRVMEQMKTKASPNQVMEQPICCVLPLQKSVQERIHFPDSPKLRRPRITRSTKTKEIQKVKSINRIVTLPIPVKCSNIKATEEIVHDYDYDNPNPYWNIQNSDIRKQQTKLSRPVNFYAEDDYNGDYEIIADELPKPGLTGIYSDTDFRPSVFKPTVLQVPESIDYGYGADDRFPVLDSRLDTSAPNRLALKKPKTKRTKQGIESQTISYHSSPDFKVLQGFKLLNLMRDKTKINRNKRPVDDEEDSDLEVLLGDLKSESVESDVDENGNVYSNCGNVLTEVSKEEEGDFGDVQYGTQPWLALVLRKRKSQRMFCHATLVHPRAAFTSASCVHGYRPGDLELYAGVWNLMVDQKSQKRTASILVHPKYSPGDLEHDIAILYWSQPLRLNKNVQPACISNFQTSDECMVVAWGKQSASRATPKWQRAPVISEECDEVFDKYGIPETDSLLCASAGSKQCLPNIGSPIICGSDSGKSAIGVVVTKDDCDMIIVPAHDWIQRSLARLRIVNSNSPVFR